MIAVVRERYNKPSATPRYAKKEGKRKLMFTQEGLKKLKEITEIHIEALVKARETAERIGLDRLHPEGHARAEKELKQLKDVLSEINEQLPPEEPKPSKCEDCPAKELCKRMGLREVLKH